MRVWASLVAQLVKNLPAGDPLLTSGSRRSPREGIGYPLQHSWASLVAQMVKNPPAMRETSVWSLGWEDPLEESMATHSSILAWRIPMDRGVWRATSPWARRVRHDWVTKQWGYIYWKSEHNDCLREPCMSLNVVFVNLSWKVRTNLKIQRKHFGKQINKNVNTCFMRKWCIFQRGQGWLTLPLWSPWLDNSP